MQPLPTDTNEPVVIACNYNAIAPDARAAHSATVEGLFAATLAIEELPDGYAFQLPLETATLHQVMDFIANERRCCPFFTFTVTVGEALWLTLTGAEEVKAFIKANMVEPLAETGQLPDPERWIAMHATSES